MTAGDANCGAMLVWNFTKLQKFSGGKAQDEDSLQFIREFERHSCLLVGLEKHNGYSLRSTSVAEPFGCMNPWPRIRGKRMRGLDMHC